MTPCQPGNEPKPPEIHYGYIICRICHRHESCLTTEDGRSGFCFQCFGKLLRGEIKLAEEPRVSPVFTTNLFRRLVTRDFLQDDEERAWSFAYACSLPAECYLNAVFAALDRLAELAASDDRIATILAPIEAEVKRMEHQLEQE